MFITILQPSNIRVLCNCFCGQPIATIGDSTLLIHRDPCCDRFMSLRTEEDKKAYVRDLRRAQGITDEMARMFVKANKEKN